MEFKINIGKTHFWIMIVTMVVIGAGIFVYAQNVHTQGHPLEEISGVDANANSIVDQAESLSVNSADHPNSFKGCIAVSSPKNTPPQSGGHLDWTTDHPAEGIVIIDLVVDGENICADGDGCEYYVRQNSDSGLGQWAFYENFYMMEDATTGYTTGLGFHGDIDQVKPFQFTNGDGTMDWIALNDWCDLVDDYPTSASGVTENSKDKIVLLDGNWADQCHVKVCD